VKITEKGGVKGYDAGKKINGRKRHILVDTMGLILMVVVHAASIQDRDGAKLVFDKISNLFPKLHLIWADAAYAGSLVHVTIKKGRKLCGDREVTWSKILGVLDKAFCKNFQS
jgi:hypothetical protein